LRTKTQQEFIEEVFSLVGNDYSVLGEYVNNHTKIKFKHNKCQRIYDVSPSNFLRGRRCASCAGNKKKTHEQFLQEVFDLVGNEYKVLGTYVTARKEIEMLHVDCGNIWKIIPCYFLQGDSMCPPCGIKKRAKKITKKHDVFIKEVFDLVGNEYSVLGKYEKINTKIKMKHNICGHIYEATPDNILRNRKCPKCFGNIRKNTEEFKAEVYELVKDEYSVLGTYINTEVKIEMKHNKCEKVYKVRPANFLNGQRCPKCKASHGEIEIAKWLELHGFKFETEYKFDDCKYIKPLPFDFAVFKEDGSLLTLIEFQGLQHYRNIRHFNNITGFFKRNINDNIKKNYCEKNHIPLIVISYWEFDRIDEILSEFFLKEGVI
jgi:hypothetical protein